MASVLEDEPRQLCRYDIKQEDTSEQTKTTVSRDVVTEHGHAQDLPETSGFQEQTTGHYENIQCKQEPNVYWDTAEENNRHVDVACTCNYSDHADVHDTKENISASDEHGITPTGISFPGEVKLVNGTCEFTVCIQKSMFSKGSIDGLGVEEIQNNIKIFLHITNTNKEDISRRKRNDYIHITKKDCDHREVTEHITAGNSPLVKHTSQKRHLCDDREKTVSTNYNVEEHRPSNTGEKSYTCTDGGRSFKRKPGFDRHRETHEKQNPLECFDFGKTVSVKCSLHSNREAQEGDKTHSCTDSEKIYTQEESLPRHRKIIQKEDCDQMSHYSVEATTNRKPTGDSFEKIEMLEDEIKERCKITAEVQNEVDIGIIPDDLGEVEIAGCGTTQSRQTSLKGDVTDFAMINSYLCEHCGKLFVQKSLLEKHLQVHMEERPYKCSECNKAYKKKSHLNIHMRNHTGERPHKCTFCDSAFIQNSHLTCHLRTHTGERPYRCSKCGKTYTFDTDFKIHMRTHTGERPYNCMNCHKTFTSKPNLNRHIRTHTGEKPHKCTHCDKTFATKNVLIDHIRIHTGEKPYKCTYCDKTFARRNVLTAHIRTHTGEKPYKCTHCDKAFRTKQILTIHIKTHTGEKPWKCTHCDKMFSIKSDLTRHIRTHSGEKPYTCSICGKTFNHKGNLRRHTLVHTKHGQQ